MQVALFIYFRFESTKVYYRILEREESKNIPERVHLMDTLGDMAGDSPILKINHHVQPGA